MSHRFSLLSGFVILITGFGGFAAYHNGWIPVEVGGAATGSIIDADSPADRFESLPEFESDHSPSLDVCGVTEPRRSQQSEPLLHDETLETTGTNGRRKARIAKKELLTEDLEDRDDEIIQAVGQANGRSRSNALQLVVEEQSVAEPDDPNSPKNAAARRAAEVETETAGEAVPDPPVRVAKRPKDQEPSFDFADIDRQIKTGQLVEAHKALSKLFWQQPELRSRVQERIDSTAKAIYFSPQPHIQEPYVIQAGDQFRKIATKHHVPWQYLSRLNHLDPKRLREGQKLKVIDGPFGAVVTLSDFELVVHHKGQYVRSYPCCIGKNNSSPTGRFKVLNKVTSPQYTDPDGKVFAGNDPKNPLGTHWIDLGDSYGIHGTIEPDSIGKAESRGCIRLLNADVSEVYDLLELGADVVIRQ